MGKMVPILECPDLPDDATLQRVHGYLDGVMGRDRDTDVPNYVWEFYEEGYLRGTEHLENAQDRSVKRRASSRGGRATSSRARELEQRNKNPEQSRGDE